MSRAMNKRLMLAIVAVALAPALALGAPEDERVSAFLAGTGLTRLLETQLFDRFVREDNPGERAALASRLASIYAGILADQNAPQADRDRARAQGEVLAGMVNQDELLALRLELLAGRFAERERDATLARIDLLSDARREASVAELDDIDRRLDALAKRALSETTRLERIANRVRADDRQRVARTLGEMRAIHSRARFLSAWTGYSLAVLLTRRVGDGVLTRFGWVLGLDGSLPVLDQIDPELYEYDHVARAALGVAQSLMHNGSLGPARVWLRSITDADETSGEIKDLARARLTEVAALGHDWISCRERSSAIIEDGTMGVATARLLVLESLAALRSRDAGRGGIEGARQTAVDMLDWLVEQGEIDHVTQLTARFDALDLIASPFLRSYAKGLGAVGASGDNDNASHEKARDHFLDALRAPDRDAYEAYARDAVLRFALAAMRADTPDLARTTLERELAAFEGDDQLERALWLLILATDETLERAPSVERGALGDRLAALVRRYLRENPDSDRATRLVTRYAPRGIIGREDAERALVIDDPNDPLAVRARRAYIELIDRDEPGDSRDAYNQILRHAAWIRAHEPSEPDGFDAARRRLNTARIVLIRADKVGDEEHDRRLRELDRADALIGAHPPLRAYAAEFALRRIRVLSESGRLERAAGVLAQKRAAMDGAIERAARTTVFAHAWDAFADAPDPRLARVIVESGRPLLAEARPGEDGTLDGRGTEILQRVMIAADTLSGAESELYDQLAHRLALRLLKEGTPGARALSHIAAIAERHGDPGTALESWLGIVSSSTSDSERWRRARYESLRLLQALDPARWRTAMDQYRLLYPEGIGEPWDARIARIGGDP